MHLAGALPILLLSIATRASSQQGTLRLIPQDSLQRIVTDRVGAGRSTGLIVGVLSATDRRLASAGYARPGKPVDAQTVFEIGSITKAFTGIVLADMIQRGEVRLDQPVSELLPASVRMPSRGGKPITLGDLASQVSGLPRLPSNMRPADHANPYADYTVEQMYEFLSRHELRRDPGVQYEYSNLGVGLLGHVLALKAGKPYEQLVRERVLAPLGMTRTAIALDAGMQRHMSEGHDPSGRVVPLWDLPTLAGAGALRSSLDDMMKLAAAILAPPNTALGRAIRMSVAPRFRANEALSLGLNWHRVILGGDTVIFHNGGTAGFRTYLGVNPRRGTAVVLLGNSAQDNEDIARHLLVPTLPLAAVVQRREISLPAETLARYVGEYRLRPQFALTVTLEGGSLQLQPTGQPKLPLFAEARDRFFLKAVDAQIAFRRDAAGEVVGLTLLQNGNRMEGARVAQAVDTSLLRVDSIWARNYARNDTATALQLMDADFFMTATNGATKNREQEMADIRPSPNLRMNYFRTTNVRTRTLDDAGVVTGIAEWSFDMHSNTSTVRRRYTAVYARGGPLGWRLVTLHMGRAD